MPKNGLLIEYDYCSGCYPVDILISKKPFNVLMIGDNSCPMVPLEIF